MKKPLYCLGLALATISCLAQGTFQFAANLVKTPGAPPDTAASETTGFFTLTGDSLAGSARFFSEMFSMDAVVLASDGAIVSTAFAQGTFQFQAGLVSTPGSTPETAASETTAIFTLSGNSLSGIATFPVLFGPMNGLVRTSDATVISSAQFRPNPDMPAGEGNPFSFMDALWEPVSLNEAHINQLMRGEMTVTIQLEPGSSVEGPLLLVPEPTSLALSGLGLLMLSWRIKGRQNTRHFEK